MTQVLEGVAFSSNSYYNMLHYLTNSGKLKATQGGLKSFLLTPNRPTRSFRIRLRAKSKRMNKFNFFGCLIDVPSATTESQLPVVADTTDINHVLVTARVRYNEWNSEFNMRKVT